MKQYLYSFAFYFLYWWLLAMCGISPFREGFTVVGVAQLLLIAIPLNTLWRRISPLIG